MKALAMTEELARFRERGFDLALSDEAFEFLARRGIHKALGARPMKKTVQKFIGRGPRRHKSRCTIIRRSYRFAAQ
jgi:ATP-dependent Clp protease ATP-binding subunit ClpA